MIRSASTSHLQWPAESFYWAVLDASPLSMDTPWRSRRRKQQLGFLFEGVIPGTPIEEVHAVYQKLPGTRARYLACGLRRSVLRKVVEEDAVTLTPAAVPSFVKDRVDPGTLNLLTGDFLSRDLRQQRRRWCMHVAAILALCVVILMVGLERRIHIRGAETEALTLAQARLLEQVLDPPDAASALQLPELRLTAELRRLQQTRPDEKSDHEAESGAAMLATLLQRWPEDLHAQTETLAVAPRSITIRAHVPTMGDAQRFADAFKDIPGWRLQQPRSEASRDRVDVTLLLRADKKDAVP